MRGVRKMSIQRYVLYLSDAFVIGARAPVHSNNILVFWSMLEFRIRSGELIVLNLRQSTHDNQATPLQSDSQLVPNNVSKATSD